MDIINLMVSMISSFTPLSLPLLSPPFPDNLNIHLCQEREGRGGRDRGVKEDIMISPPDIINLITLTFISVRKGRGEEGER